MNTKFDTRPVVLSAILLLSAAFPLLAQITPTQRLTAAFALEREGKPEPATVELQALLHSNSLNAVDSGKAWNILGLAYEDMGKFSLSQHAYEESLRILEGLPDNIQDYAMALNDFGGLYVTTGQFEIADKMRTKALGIYEKVEDHGGIARTCGDLAGVAFSQKRVASGSKYLERAVKEVRLANDLEGDDRVAIASLQGWKAQLDGDFTMSAARYRQALDLSKRLHGEEHPSTGWGYLLLGEAHAEAGQLTNALGEMRQGVAVLDRTLSRQNPHYLVAEMAYSRVLEATGSHAEATRIKASAETLLKDVYREQCAGCTISAAAFH
ncbi:MAG TPA: tetratricopeptide repeat protein [Edaphobacter sp.]|nr:tetratricopeptide repeat protein [Edaphobacter sp.]